MGETLQCQFFLRCILMLGLFSWTEFWVSGQNRCGQTGGNLVFVKTANFEIHYYDHTSSVEAQESHCLQVSWFFGAVRLSVQLLMASFL